MLLKIDLPAIRKYFSRFFICLSILLIPIQQVFAEASESSVGLKAGMLMEGEFYADPPDDYFASDSGFLLLLNLDTMLAEKLSAGLFYLRSNTGAYDESAIISTYGVTFKAHLNKQSKVKIRPGISIGYQKMNFDTADDVTGLGIGGFVELLFPDIAGQDLLAEAGFISQPAGGNKDIDLTFAPIFYLTGGVNFDF